MDGKAFHCQTHRTRHNDEIGHSSSGVAIAKNSELPNSKTQSHLLRSSEKERITFWKLELSPFRQNLQRPKTYGCIFWNQNLWIVFGADSPISSNNID
jgi:hypothetical protein